MGTISLIACAVLGGVSAPPDCDAKPSLVAQLVERMRDGDEFSMGLAVDGTKFERTSKFGRDDRFSPWVIERAFPYSGKGKITLTLTFKGDTHSVKLRTKGLA